jgi:hypothetical protein
MFCEQMSKGTLINISKNHYDISSQTRANASNGKMLRLPFVRQIHFWAFQFFQFCITVTKVRFGTDQLGFTKSL